MKKLTSYKFPLFVFLSSLVLLFLKSPDAVLLPQFWAEDGAIFFAAQYHYDWPQVFTAYAGYLHAVSRLVAWVATLFDLSLTPLIYNASALVIDAICIAFVVQRMRPWFSWWAVFLPFFIIPTNGEIFGTITNVHWFLQFAMAAACFAPPISTETSRGLRWLGYIALFLVSLSGPFSIIVAGLASAILLMTLVPGKNSLLKLQPRLSVLFSTIDAVRAGLPLINILVVATGAVIQGVVLVTHNVNVPATQFMLTLQEQQTFGLIGLHQPTSYSSLALFALPYIAELVLVAAIAVLCLIWVCKKEAPWAGMGLLFLSMGAVQPVLAYLKTHYIGILAPGGRYCFFLIVVSCWIGWRMFTEALPAYRKVAGAAVFSAVTVGIILYTNSFSRAPLTDLEWSKFAGQIRRHPDGDIIVPINPIPWAFKLGNATETQAEPAKK